MIAAWYEDKSSPAPRGPAMFVAKLATLGVEVRRVERPAEADITLVFAAPDAPIVTELSAKARARTILFAERSAGDPAAKRAELGLLGLIDSRAWFRWCGGAYVTRGLHGRPEIASAANLVASAEGLVPADDSLSLPEVLARYLTAAQRVL